MTIIFQLNQNHVIMSVNRVFFFIKTCCFFRHLGSVHKYFGGGVGSPPLNFAVEARSLKIVQIDEVRANNGKECAENKVKQ